MDEIADNVVDAFQDVADDEGKELCAHVEPGCSLMGDRVLLTQLISNLIENALRHTHPLARTFGWTSNATKAKRESLSLIRAPAIQNRKENVFFDTFIALMRVVYDTG